MKSKDTTTSSANAIPATAAQTVTVRSLLVGWANQQDGWVRQLVSEIILAGKHTPKPVKSASIAASHFPLKR